MITRPIVAQECVVVRIERFTVLKNVDTSRSYPIYIYNPSVDVINLNLERRNKVCRIK